MADAAFDLDAAVRRHDPNRWLASRFIADADKRADVVALYAFHHELARVAGAVSNPIMGQIRLTWWEEAVAEIHDGRPVRKHPVAEALAMAVGRRALSRPLLDQMIEARFPELEGDSVDVEASEGALMRLAARVLSGQDWPRLAVVARYYGGQGDRSEANAAAAELPVEAFPAVAYVALKDMPQGSALRRRAQITLAVLRGRL